MMITCRCCERRYTVTDFLDLEPPNGKGEAMGLYWRQCECTNTLTAYVAEVKAARQTEPKEAT